MTMAGDCACKIVRAIPVTSAEIKIRCMGFIVLLSDLSETSSALRKCQALHRRNESLTRLVDRSRDSLRDENTRKAHFHDHRHSNVGSPEKITQAAGSIPPISIRLQQNTMLARFACNTVVG